ncbi:Protein of unknown function [Bacillus cereus]|nr:Protein of unknown function [Bacillus cereus]
MSEDEQNRPTD